MLINKQTIRTLLLTMLIITCQLILSWYVAYFISFVKFDHQSIFLADLVGKPIFLPFWVFYFSGAACTFLIWLIAREFFPDNWSLLPPLIFGISLWPVYLMAAQANSIVTLMLLLGLFISFLRWKEKQGSIKLVAIFIGILYYFSFLTAPVIWLVFLFSVVTGYIKTSQKSRLFLIIIIMYLPIILGSLYNPEGFTNLSKQQIKIFSGPGLLNGINSFKGESQKAGFNTISKLTENKYLYLSEYLLLKGLKHVNLSTYFTPQEKLLNFSFSSPLYLGFIFPFLYGLYRIFKDHLQTRKMLLISLPLILPSILAESLVDLNRLILIMPVIVFIISYGLLTLYRKRRTALNKIFLFSIAGLVLIQIIISLTDITYREYPRYRRYFGPLQTEVGKQ